MKKGEGGVKLLSRGLFERPFMDSRAQTENISTKEWVLGHLIGPLGLIFVVNTIAALVEKFFTQQTGAIYGVDNIAMIQRMGSVYEVVMTAAKILAMFTGLLNGWLIQHTQSRQGRMRPWHLIFGFVSIIIGCLIFLFPGTKTMGDAYWYYFFFLLICYHTVGSSYFYLFRDTICSLTTRDSKEKTKISFIRKMSWTLLSGIVIGMVFNMVLLPLWLEKDINGYPVLMIILSVCAVPLLLLEYFYTRERVTEDVAVEYSSLDETKIPLRDQMKALLSNRYFVILIVIATLSGIVDNYKGGNVQYFYIKFMLNGENNAFMYTIYQTVTGTPLGLGAFLIYPLVKKFGIKNITVGGYALVLVGSVVGWLFPSNLTVALVAGFVRNIGWLPNSYIFATLLCFAYDSIEYRSHLRLEGLMGVAIIMALQSLIYAPFAGGFESSILHMGFVDAVGVTPGAEVTSFMTSSFYLFDAALALAVVILLPFVDVEKHLPEINSELLRRKKEAVLASGGTWIDPEEQKRIDEEKEDAEREKNRIADLRARCEKKGLDFDEENRKYLEKAARKEAKKKKGGKK